MNQEKIWKKLQAFEFPKGFQERLSKEQNWSVEFTEQAIDEYRKFIFLAKFSSPVTPSKVIDDVWHLHLIYTSSYWIKMCVGILGKMIHHTPGDGEDDDFEEQYLRTLQSLEKNFGKPNEQFWPRSKIRKDSTSSLIHDSSNTVTNNYIPDSPIIFVDPISTDNSNSESTSFGGGQFGGGGAGYDFDSSNSGNDSSPSSCSSSGDSGGSSCSSSSCGSSCGSGCGGGD